MPAKSQAQRGYLAVHFGPAWMKKHHFDNPGKLPKHVKGYAQGGVVAGAPASKPAGVMPGAAHPAGPSEKPQMPVEVGEYPPNTGAPKVQQTNPGGKHAKASKAAIKNPRPAPHLSAHKSRHAASPYSEPF